jgi:DUF4097 and DUF4098 domain-containing protein YvlB
MKRNLENVLISLAGFFLIFLLTELAFGDEIYREYTGKDQITIKTLAGNCEIRPSHSDKITVRVINSVRPKDAFDADFKDRGNTLVFTENLRGSSSGASRWLITAPDGIDINFRSTSGSMSIADLTGKFMSNTASGDVEVERCRGEFNFESASGGYDIYNCEGEFDIHGASGNLRLKDIIVNSPSEFASASGDVNGRGIIVKSKSTFGSASGSVEIVLGDSPAADLNVGSASGDATLDYNGAEPIGFFEMTAKRYDGVIKSDIEFDKEEQFTKNDQLYIRKTARLKDDMPYISVGTGTGRAELRR